MAFGRRAAPLRTSAIPALGTRDAAATAARTTRNAAARYSSDATHSLDAGAARLSGLSSLMTVFGSLAPGTVSIVSVSPFTLIRLICCVASNADGGNAATTRPSSSWISAPETVTTPARSSGSKRRAPYRPLGREKWMGFGLSLARMGPDFESASLKPRPMS